ncbi:MAG: hypothetical protein JWM95_541 [Gemmatimonadetes bacterium]|nr:hypothetical protein [Gemmatimonadota bacterium]
MADLIPVYADNDFVRIISGLTYFDPSDGNEKPKPWNNATTIRAFWATTDQLSATPADPALTTLCPYIPRSAGDYALKFKGSVLSFARMNGIFGTPIPNGLHVRDTFTRADNPSTPGVGEYIDGGSRAVVAGTAGILSNKAYFSALVNTFGVWMDDVLVSDVIASLTISAFATSETWLHIRATDLNNELALIAVGGVLVLNSVVAGNGEIIETRPYTPVPGDRWTVRCEGTTITVSVNDVIQFVATGITGNRAGTRFGPGVAEYVGSTSPARFDDWEIDTLPPPMPFLHVASDDRDFHVVYACEYFARRDGEVEA